jgi:hypothetical protein
MMFGRNQYADWPSCKRCLKKYSWKINDIPKEEEGRFARGVKQQFYMKLAPLWARLGGSHTNFWASYSRIGEAGTPGPKMPTDKDEKQLEKEQKAKWRSFSMARKATSRKEEKKPVRWLPKEEEGTEVVLRPRTSKVVLTANKNVKKEYTVDDALKKIKETLTAIKEDDDEYEKKVIVKVEKKSPQRSRSMSSNTKLAAAKPKGLAKADTRPNRERTPIPRRRKGAVTPKREEVKKEKEASPPRTKAKLPPPRTEEPKTRSKAQGSDLLKELTEESDTEESENLLVDHLRGEEEVSPDEWELMSPGLTMLQHAEIQTIMKKEQWYDSPLVYAALRLSYLYANSTDHYGNAWRKNIMLKAWCVLRDKQKKELYYDGIQRNQWQKCSAKSLRDYILSNEVTPDVDSCLPCEKIAAKSLVKLLLRSNTRPSGLLA